MSEDYEREKLGLAVDVLAASAAPIQKRLEYAWMAFHTLVAQALAIQSLLPNFPLLTSA